MDQFKAIARKSLALAGLLIGDLAGLAACFGLAELAARVLSGDWTGRPAGGP